MITISLNENEANALLGLLDIATKAGGLQVAENAIFFVKKIQEAAQINAATSVAPDAPAPAE